MKTVKLFTSKLQTYGNCQWKMGEEKTTSGGGDLCSSGWLHFYRAPTIRMASLVAVFLDPSHGYFRSGSPQLWEVRVGGEQLHDGQMKSGCTRMTPIRQLAMPEMTKPQRIAIAIYCGLQICKEKRFVKWAQKWLSGEDRSPAAGWATAVCANDWVLAICRAVVDEVECCEYWTSDTVVSMKMENERFDLHEAIRAGMKVEESPLRADSKNAVK